MARDAVAVLKEDHKKLKGLLEEITSTNGPKRQAELLENIEAEVMVHTQVEEAPRVWRRGLRLTA